MEKLSILAHELTERMDEVSEQAVNWHFLHSECKSSAFPSRGDGTRTHTVRILSPKTCVLACPSVSEIGLTYRFFDVSERFAILLRTSLY